MRHSDQINEIALALSKAQATVKGAIKDSNNPFFKSQYADLQSVWDACRAALTANELAVVQSAGTDGPMVRVSTMLVHSSGQWFADDLALKPKDDGPQAMGACISYGRRYALAAFVGVYQTDDDAESAEGRKAAPAVRKPDPEAYATWKDDISAVAAEGLENLKEAWQSSPLEFRTHVMQSDKAWWTALKAKAEAEAK